MGRELSSYLSKWPLIESAAPGEEPSLPSHCLSAKHTKDVPSVMLPGAQGPRSGRSELALDDLSVGVAKRV